MRQRVVTSTKRTVSNAHNIKWVCQQRKHRKESNIMKQRKTHHWVICKRGFAAWSLPTTLYLLISRHIFSFISHYFPSYFLVLLQAPLFSLCLLILMPHLFLCLTSRLFYCCIVFLYTHYSYFFTYITSTFLSLFYTLFFIIPSFPLFSLVFLHNSHFFIPLKRQLLFL